MAGLLERFLPREDDYFVLFAKQAENIHAGAQGRFVTCSRAKRLFMKRCKILSPSVTVVTTWIVRKQRPLKVDRWFCRLQLISAAAYSLGHGTNDAQKGVGIITTPLVAGDLLKTYDVPYWVHKGLRVASLFPGPRDGLLLGTWTRVTFEEIESDYASALQACLLEVEQKLRRH